jgi:threonine/homoserine efflux transporter RhtA
MGLLTTVPSPALVLGAIASVQFGAAIAVTLFAQIGPGGAVWLRLLGGTAILVPLWRPRWRGRSRSDLLLAGLFGLVLASMNFTFYSSIHRIPLGIAVTFEFIGPLMVAIAGSRRPLDLLWVALAGAGILALTQGGVDHLDPLGVALALIAGGLWAAYILINARVGRAFEGATGLSLAMCVATLLMTPVGVVQGGSHLLEPRSLLLGSRRPAFLGDPLLVRERGPPADPSGSVRRVDEHRAGHGGAGGVHRARTGTLGAGSAGDRTRGGRLGGSGAARPRTRYRPVMPTVSSPRSPSRLMTTTFILR